MLFSGFFAVLVAISSMASERKYGFELTFTSAKIIEQTQSPTQRTTKEAKKILANWSRFAKEQCEIFKCVTEAGKVKQHPSLKIKFADGFWMEISHDPSVLEITMMPGTQEHYLKHRAVIERFGFEAAKNFGLYVHERIGGGHINYDLQSVFKNDPLLIRNFIVDRANHPELAWGLFGNHLGNAPPFAALKSESKVALYRLIHDFDNGLIKTAEELFLRIEKEVYTNNPYDWSPGAYAHYQDLSFEKAQLTTQNPHPRIEVRGQRPQQNFEHLLKDIELAEHNLDYLSKLQKPIHLDMPANADFNSSYAITHFYDWAKVRSLDPEAYKEIILPKAAAAETSTNNKPVNEVHNTELYSEISDIYKELSSSQIKELISESTKTGSDNRYLIPHPKMLSQAQLETLQSGTAQRLRALLAFRKDLEDKEFKIVKSGILPQEILERIAKKAGLEKAELMDLKERNNVGFYYAPDIVMGSDGRFKVLEDNLGYAGGMGDAMQSRLDLLKLAPEYASILENKGEGFAHKLSELLRAEASPHDGALVLFVPASEEAYNRYYIQQVEAAGIHVLTEQKRNGKSLTVVDGTPYLVLEGSGGKAQKIQIGAAMIRNFNYTAFANAFPNTLKCILSGKLPLLGLPLQRFDILSDKETARYVEEFIRFYLGEEPLLKTAETISFREVGPAGETLLKKDKLDQVFKNISNYVIKDTQGLQGKQVWIGSHLDKATIEKLKQTIQINPGAYIAQEYIHVSRIERWITDIRVHAAALGNSITVSDIFWGRALSIFGDGKLNTHQDAGVIPIFVRERDQAEGRLLGFEQELKAGKVNAGILQKLKALQDSTNLVAKKRAQKIVANNVLKYAESIESVQDLEITLEAWPFHEFAGPITLTFLARYKDLSSLAHSAEAILKSSLFDAAVKNQIRANLSRLLWRQQDLKMTFTETMKYTKGLLEPSPDLDLKLAFLNLLIQKATTAEDLLAIAEQLKLDPIFFRSRSGQNLWERFKTLAPTPEQVKRWQAFYPHPLFSGGSPTGPLDSILRHSPSKIMCSGVF